MCGPWIRYTHSASLIWLWCAVPLRPVSTRQPNPSLKWCFDLLPRAAHDMTEMLPTLFTCVHLNHQRWEHCGLEVKCGHLKHLKLQHGVCQYVGQVIRKEEKICKLELVNYFVICKTLIQPSQPWSDVVLAHIWSHCSSVQNPLTKALVVPLHVVLAVFLCRAEGSQRVTGQCLGPVPSPQDGGIQACMKSKYLGIFANFANSFTVVDSPRLFKWKLNIAKCFETSTQTAM